MEATATIPQGPLAERRRYPRLQCRAETQFRELLKPQQKFTGSLSFDLSIGGLRLTTPVFPPRGSKLVVLFSLPILHAPIRMITRVAWVRQRPFSEGSEVGLEFLEVAPEDQARVADYVERGILVR